MPDARREKVAAAVWKVKRTVRNRRSSRLQNRAWSVTNVYVGAHSELSPQTTIGRGTTINAFARVLGPADVSIGPFCAVGEYFRVLLNDHRTDLPNVQAHLAAQHGWGEVLVSKPVSVGPACWIGDGVKILGGANIGAGCVIAAGALVRPGDYPPFSVIGGVPARVLKSRCSPEVRDVLMEAAWWNWSDERIAAEREFFTTNITTADAAQLRRAVIG